MSGLLLDTNIPSEFTRQKSAARILPVTAPIAERWGVLSGECRLKGRQIKLADGLIVATALHHKLTLVTRNVKDFAGLGVTVLNPWDAS